MNLVSCGCGSCGCTCFNHQDVPNGRPPKRCDLHKTIPIGLNEQWIVEYSKWLRGNKPECYVSMSSNNPYHCSVCGDTYYPCKHWNDDYIEGE